ncbi:hypothetical protein, partial [Mesorhizobium sp. M6A.T.Ce.TU.016.01.1.1]|uniref:hypothetical protein n=1 Tax=Mesorhizobium sp. M6A.T.Ce.TU.016.01.1.1 TaxID=2496783 RepID=UPI001AEC8D39
EPVGSIRNLFIFVQLQYPALLLIAPPVAVATMGYFVVSIAFSYCMDGNYLPLNRAGTVLGTLGFLYVLVEEVWQLSPQIVSDEIEGSFSDMGLETHPDSVEPLRKFRAFASWAEAAHKPLVRTVEALLVVIGGILSGFGDLAGTFL